MVVEHKLIYTGEWVGDTTNEDLIGIVRNSKEDITDYKYMLIGYRLDMKNIGISVDVPISLYRKLKNSAWYVGLPGGEYSIDELTGTCVSTKYKSVIKTLEVKEGRILTLNKSDEDMMYKLYMGNEDCNIHVIHTDIASLVIADALIRKIISCVHSYRDIIFTGYEVTKSLSNFIVNIRFATLSDVGKFLSSYYRQYKNIPAVREGKAITLSSINESIVNLDSVNDFRIESITGDSAKYNLCGVFMVKRYE